MQLTDREHVLVTGAAGFIGRDLVEHLRGVGWRVKALVRSGRAAGLAPAEGMVIAAGDMRDRDSLVRAMDGVRVVAHLAAKKSDEPESHAVNVEGARRLVEAARVSGVRRVINVSTQSVKLPHRGLYGETKRQAEEILHASGLDVTTLRPSIVYGHDVTGVFARMRHFITRLPVVPVMGDGTWRSRPIHVRDVSVAIAACIARDATVGRTYDLGGPDEVTFDELIDAIAAALGYRRRKVHIPVLAGLSAARVLRRLSARPAVTVSNVLGSTQKTDCDPRPAVADLGVIPIGLREGLERVLDDEVRLRHGIARAPILRVAVVGLGKMGLFHAALLGTLPNVRLVATVDVDPALGRSARSMGLAVPFFTSLDALLAARPVHAVFVCTPTWAHEAAVRACLARRLHVLVEKPLALNAAQSGRLAALAEAAGVVHAVGYHLASSPVFQRAGELLAAGVLGPLTSYRSILLHGEVLGRKRGWMFDRAKAGGGLLRNTGSHLIFLLHLFFGLPASVSAKTAAVHSREIEDTVTATLEYPSGLTGTLDSSWSMPGKPLMELRLEVAGARGSLLVDGTDIMLDLHGAGPLLPEGRHRIHASDLSSEGVFDLAPEASGAAYHRQDRAFVDACLEGKGSRTPFDAAARAERVIDAMYESAERGVPVALA